VIKAFQRVLAKSEGRVLIYLQTDKGKEFVAQSMQKFLKENDIRFRVTRNLDVKAAIVESASTETEGANVALFRIKIHDATSIFFRMLYALIITRITRP